ncbi:MAG: helix-turn-helix domain-containing protein [Candidatus Mariimomonas ferrooxydans]
MVEVVWSLWGDENDTYRFFTYMCPRLYDLDTVAYWILEKDAHSQKFKANLRHITQVVFELYKRREMLYLKALKLDRRDDREAFKPHLYEITNQNISISLPKKEVFTEIGSRLKDLRAKFGMSQKELAEKIDLTPSFMSQVENNQISPSLSSFMQICNALGVSPSELLGDKPVKNKDWLIRKKEELQSPALNNNGFKVFSITGNGSLPVHTPVHVAVMEPDATVKKHISLNKGEELIYVLKGRVSVVIDDVRETLNAGDTIYLRKEFPSLWKNELSESAELLTICL